MIISLVRSEDEKLYAVATEIDLFPVTVSSFVALINEEMRMLDSCVVCSPDDKSLDVRKTNELLCAKYGTIIKTFQSIDDLKYYKLEVEEA